MCLEILKMPAGGALFGSATAGPGSTGGNKHLIEIRAGKMSLKGRINSQLSCLFFILILNFGTLFVKDKYETIVNLSN